MNSYIFGQLIETGLLVLLGVCFLVIIGTSFHDVWMTRRLQASRKQERKLQKNRPHVTVLVYAHNSASVTAACLESIIKTRYRQYDIVVVNNASTDETKRRILAFKNDHPATRMVVYNKRRHSPIKMALQQAYKKSQHGEIILTIRAEVMLTHTFLKDSVVHFMTLNAASFAARTSTSYPADTTLLLFNEYIAASQSFLVLQQYFSQASRHLIKKISSHIKTSSVVVGDSLLRSHYAAMFSPSALKNARLSTKQRSVYDNRIPLLIMPADRSMLREKRSAKMTAKVFFLSSILVISVTYSLYMAATLQQTSLLLIGWLVVTVWFIAVIWSDEASAATHKLRLSVMIPSLYFLLYLTVIAALLTQIIRLCLLTFRTLSRSIVVFYASQPAPLKDW